MKKRTFVCFLIFTVCVFHSSLPGTVFGQAASLAEQVLEKYSDILQREDIQEILPAVLEGLKAPNIQALLNPGTITLVVTQPDLLTRFVPGIDPAFITLLKTDAELKTMLSDAQVQALLQDASAIDELINALNAGELPPSLPAHVYPGSSLPAGAGETLTVDIDIAGGSGVAGYELTVAFDTSALTYVSAANATYLPTGAFAPAPRVSGNRVTLTAAAGSAATKSSGTLATVTFRVAAVKASELHLQNVILSDIDGDNLAVRALTNSVSVVRSSGAAWDVNQDGSVNVSDLVLVARHLGSSSPANPRVDVNQDGSVNVSDLVLVARHLGEEGDEGDSSVQVVPIDIPGGGDGGDDDTRERTEPPGMVLIPAGQFQMGSNDEDADNAEQPVHTVHLDAFYMDIYEVTNAQFKAFVDANPQWQKDNIEDRFHNGEYLYLWSGNDYPSGKAEHPVVAVTWYAAMAYAAWAGKRLPTEAEWEYAARGGLAGKKYPWGDYEPDLSDAHYFDDFHESPPIDDTTVVGTCGVNGYGLYDMAGNVWEWCLDEFDADFYAKSRNSRNPISGARTIQWILDNFTSIPTNSHRVLRGGSWDNGAFNLRVADRYGKWPTLADHNSGFRCARAVTP